jgi:hypothetical protein
MSAIEEFARDILDEKELELALYLSKLLANPNNFIVGILVSKILPTYSEKRGDSSYTLDPDPIYRPLYYVHGYANTRHFKDNTRIFLDMTAAHLEGCLLWLTRTPPKFRSAPKPFGPLVLQLLHEGLLPRELADELLRFNKIVNVPAKHMTSFYKPHSRIDERTFSCLDASLAFMAMRKLSIELFKILCSRGINLPSSWKEFDEQWLSPSWSSKRLKDYDIKNIYD